MAIEYYKIEPYIGSTYAVYGIEAGERVLAGYVTKGQIEKFIADNKKDFTLDKVYGKISG